MTFQIPDLIAIFRDIARETFENQVNLIWFSKFDGTAGGCFLNEREQLTSKGKKKMNIQKHR